MSTEPNIVLRRDWTKQLGACGCCGEPLAHARVVSVNIELQCRICEHHFEISFHLPEDALEGTAPVPDALGCCPSCHECRLIPVRVE